MQIENQEKLQCPECESKNIRFRFKVNTKEKNNASASVLLSKALVASSKTSNFDCL